MQIDWATKVLASLRGDIMKHALTAGALTLAGCDELIVRYAQKALEFAVVQQDSSGTSRTRRVSSEHNTYYTAGQ